MRTLSYVTLLALCAALGGCATAYQKNGLTGGYTDKKLSESSYYVDFSGNGYASGERVHMFFLYRCAELTLEKGFDYLLIIPDKPKKAEYRAPEEPGARNAMWYSDDEAGQLQPAYYYTYTITTFYARGRVEMFRAPLSYDVPWVIDARKLKAEIQPYVDSDGKTRAPDLKNLFRRLEVTHEAISYPTQDRVKISALDATDADKELRSADEIAEVFRKNEILLHVLFNGRRKITGGSDGGRIDLAFTVTPNGVVSSPRVVATTFKDYSFAVAVAQSLKDFEFQAWGVPMTRVELFSVEFQPNY